MTGSKESYDQAGDLDVRRRRIRFRAWRRGMRELDMLLGAFVDAEIDALDASEIAALERLLGLPDDEVFRWLSGSEPTPVEHDTPVFRKIAAFHSHDGPIHL
jgi:antitoxin CptB